MIHLICTGVQGAWYNTGLLREAAAEIQERSTSSVEDICLVQNTSEYRLPTPAASTSPASIHFVVTWRFYVGIFTAQLTMVLPYHWHRQGVRVVVRASAVNRSTKEWGLAWNFASTTCWDGLAKVFVTAEIQDGRATRNNSLTA